MFPIAAVIPIGLAIWATFNGFNLYNKEFAQFDSSFHDIQFKSDLNRLVYGHYGAMNILMKKFQDNSSYGSHVMLFTGGPGVGKTYVASLIKKHYEPKDMAVTILPSSQPLNDTTLILTLRKVGRVSKGFGLVIIDGIDFKSNELLDFLVVLDKFCKENNIIVKVIVIGDIIKAYSAQNDQRSVGDFNTLDEYLGFLNAVSKYTLQLYKIKGINKCDQILFLPLSREAVIECINNAATAQNKEISEQELELVVNYILEEQGDFAPSGCKDVDSYLNMLHYQSIIK
jgi:hypothetical protein